MSTPQWCNYSRNASGITSILLDSLCPVGTTQSVDQLYADALLQLPTLTESAFTDVLTYHVKRGLILRTVVGGEVVYSINPRAIAVNPTNAQYLQPLFGMTLAGTLPVPQYSPAYCVKGSASLYN